MRVSNKQRTRGRAGRLAPPRQARGPPAAAPRPLTKMRLKRLFSLGGSCTLGMAAPAGQAGCPSRTALRDGPQGKARLRIGLVSPGSAHWPRAGAGRVGQGCWPGLARAKRKAVRTGRRGRKPRLGTCGASPAHGKMAGRGPPPRAWRRAGMRACGVTRGRVGGGSLVSTRFAGTL